MSILNFTDLHLGLKAGYSSQLPNGLVTSEAEAIKVLNHILERSSKDDIDMIIFGGDLTHTNHPTSLISQLIVDWAIQMDKLNKPVYIITGNHDLSNYSHSSDFISPLIVRGLVKNIHLITSDVESIEYNGRKIFFVPFVWGEITNKYTSVEESIRTILSENKSDIVVVSHFQEASSVSGSETAMIAKSTEKFDVDSVDSQFSNVLLLLGHIHNYQRYSKANGIDVCYAGNPSYHDRSDCNKPKGYVVIDKDWNIAFEAVPDLIKFYRYVIPVGVDPETYFSGMRLPDGSVAYVDNNIESETEYISDYEMSKILSKYNIILANIKNIVTSSEQSLVIEFNNDKSHKAIFKNTVEAIHKENPFSDSKLAAVLSYGEKLIDEAEGTK